MALRALFALFVALGLVGCPGVVPGSRAYAASDDTERQLLLQARRDVFPDDVRADPAGYRETVVLWSSIVRKVEIYQGDQVRIWFEHHYWDFIEDLSIQKAIAFLSPRGEGSFTATFPAGTTVKVGDMALVYGVLDHVEPNGSIALTSRKIRTLREELYATDVWDYGRAYLLKHDMKDFRVLRVPMR